MKDRIYITEEDAAKLRGMIEQRFAANDRDVENLTQLEAELDNAEIVEADQIPGDVITMNSEVLLEDLDSGEKKTYRLVFPSQVGAVKNGISILAPIGTGLLGYSVGDTIEWKVPRGIRRFKVLNILYQPEAAAQELTSH